MPNFVKRYKDKDKARKIRNVQRQKYYAKTAVYPARLWSADEEKAVLAHSIPDMELSVLIGRSVESIQLKRSRLKQRGAK